MAATDSPTKRSGFSFPFFRRKDKEKAPPSAEVAEVNQRKALSQEGHKYLSKATDLINNRDHQHAFEPGHLDLLQDRWAELYGSAPKGKKLTKGLMTPEEFREKSKILLEDVQAAFDGIRLDRSVPSSSHHGDPMPPQAPPPIEHHTSIRRGSSHRGHAITLTDHGPVPIAAPPPERSGSYKEDRRASRKNSVRPPEEPILEVAGEVPPESSSRKKASLVVVSLVLY
ncbi:hypothetical protein DXG03_001590 [Asterophora parasitica]|uniref:Uncharacterized protein n=1 Tax=Asterophora parasitica TaxID=117018 RepID=A0A9P7KBH7_9AGAR|nr:hypothetical protein DXG03_001590 [Asterophora parasitica]